ncbi:hypothetical protein GCM10017557_44830 [Streptomyces aurantiacus]|uniref:Uncharacterized protein n=1 Tax=Streptomyces aurantiacus TaxID=47760 RepID=A0A7G1P6X4_9ACTN|nr:hypothetical protein GCM10017557_44830 [Streptomyces aurantiacus]
MGQRLGQQWQRGRERERLFVGQLLVRRWLVLRRRLLLRWWRRRVRRRGRLTGAADTEAADTGQLSSGPGTASGPSGTTSARWGHSPAGACLLVTGADGGREGVRVN